MSRIQNQPTKISGFSIHHQQTHKKRGQGQNPIYKSLKLNIIPKNKPTQGGERVSQNTKTKKNIKNRRHCGAQLQLMYPQHNTAPAPTSQEHHRTGRKTVNAKGMGSLL